MSMVSVTIYLNQSLAIKTINIKLPEFYINSGISRKLKNWEENHKINQRNLCSTGFLNLFKCLFLFKETKSQNCIGWILDVDWERRWKSKA